MENTPVALLQDRYQCGRTKLYETLLKTMDRAGLGTPVRYQNRSYVSPEQLQFLDALDLWMQQNGSDVEKFLAEREGSQTKEGSLITAIDHKNSSLAELEPKDRMILEALFAIVQRNPPNTLTNFDELEKAALNRWRLPTSKLAKLLELSTLRGNTIERYGFKCTRIRTSSKQDEWIVEKLD